VKRARRRFGWAAAAAGVAVAAWLAGLIWFAETIPETVDDPESATDAIVVLTGGSQRIESGLKLFEAGKAKKLFISGVYHTVDVAELLRTARQSPESVQCCIVLGYAADNTFGNARETAVWMHNEGFTSLRLVTAAYHMRRSMLEFSRAMPGVRIVTHPVFTDNIKQERWWSWRGTFLLIAGEYDKYLFALVRPWVGGDRFEIESSS